MYIIEFGTTASSVNITLAFLEKNSIVIKFKKLDDNRPHFLSVDLGN